MGKYIHGSYEFTVINDLGSGGFGKVFEVSLPRTDETYALKIYDPEPQFDGLLFRGETQCNHTDTLFDRFKQEMRYQAECRHDNITKVYAFSLDTGFFVMEKGDLDLSKLISEGSLTSEQKIGIVLDVLEGLKYLHEVKGLLHRDLKPKNILIFKNSPTGMLCKISDFGLIKNVQSKNPHDVVTGIGIAMGTENYMAPEIRAAAIYSEQSDIFAMGMIMDEMQIEELDDIIRKCISTRPKDRYKSVSDVIAAIEKRM